MRQNLFVESNFVSDRLTERRFEFVGDTSRDRSSGDPSGLRVPDEAVESPSEFEADFRELRRLSGAGFAADDDNLILSKQGRDFIFALNNRQLGVVVQFERTEQLLTLVSIHAKILIDILVFTSPKRKRGVITVFQLAQIIPRLRLGLIRNTMKYLLPVLFIFLTLGVVMASGTEFYVDSRSGDDSRMGTSSRAAWKSLNKVNDAKLQPGDSVLFKADGVWFGSLDPVSGESGKPILYGSYGKGAKPSFRRSVPLNKAILWGSEGDNYWKTKPIVVRESKTARPGAQGTWKTSQLKDAKGRLESFVWDGKPGIRLLCESPGSDFWNRGYDFVPISIEAGKQYVFRFRAKASIPFTMKSKYIRFLQAEEPYDVYCQPDCPDCEIKKEWNEFSILLKNEKTTSKAKLVLSLGQVIPKGCDFQFLPIAFTELETNSIGLEYGVGNLIYNSGYGIRKASPEQCREQGDYYLDENESRILMFSKKNPAAAYTKLEATLMGSPTISLSGKNFVILDSLDVRHTGGHGIQGSGVSNVIIRNCDVSWIGGGHTSASNKDARGGNGIEFYGNAENVLIENCQIGEIFGTGLAFVGGANNRRSNLIIRGNTIWNCDVSVGFFPDTVIEKCLLEKNSCFGAGAGWGKTERDRTKGIHFQFDSVFGIPGSIQLKANRLSTASGPLLAVRDKTNDQTKTVIRSEKNTFWQSTHGALAQFGNTSFATDKFEEYRKTTGWDADSDVKDWSFSPPEQ